MEQEDKVGILYGGGGNKIKSIFGRTCGEPEHEVNDTGIVCVPCPIGSAGLDDHSNNAKVRHRLLVLIICYITEVQRPLQLSAPKWDRRLWRARSLSLMRPCLLPRKRWICMVALRAAIIQYCKSYLILSLGMYHNDSRWLTLVTKVL